MCYSTYHFPFQLLFKYLPDLLWICFNNFIFHSLYFLGFISFWFLFHIVKFFLYIFSEHYQCYYKISIYSNISFSHGMFCRLFSSLWSCFTYQVSSCFSLWAHTACVWWVVELERGGRQRREKDSLLWRYN